MSDGELMWVAWPAMEHGDIKLVLDAHTVPTVYHPAVSVVTFFPIRFPSFSAVCGPFQTFKESFWTVLSVRFFPVRGLRNIQGV